MCFEAVVEMLTFDVSGSLRDIYVGADYGFNERMAVGLAYNDVSTSVDASETGGFEGSLDCGYDAFLLYLKAVFRATACHESVVS